MARDYSFKKFSNQSRVFRSEEAFSGGMNYTDSPIDAGQSKMLVNFDIADDGYSLKPRAGIKLDYAAFVANEANTNVINNFPNNATTTNICAIGDYFYQNILYKYVVMLDTATKKVFIGTIAPIIPTNVSEANNIKTEGMDIAETFIYSDYIDYTGATIHDEAIANKRAYAKQQVGTKAWNGAYYFFGKNGNETGLYFTAFNTDTKRFYFKKVEPTTLTALEASPNKFNMLLKNPYVFQNNITAGAFVLHGVLCYNDTNSIVVSPKIKTKYTYKLAYSAPASTKYKITWEWKDFNGTSWTMLKEQTITTGSTAIDLSCDFASPIKDSLMRVTITGYTNDAINTYPDQVLATPISCDTEIQNSAANAELKNYDLTKATGMCYWQNRLVLWGFSEDNIILASETNLPEWFAYPNNVDMFEEPIIHCEPYLDSLLVFTTQKLYKLTMLSDGSGWTKTCIQDHLYLTTFDTNLIQTIKNMVFFKSGNSYFMVVPSAATTSATGLTIAPISKPIQWLLDNFKTTVLDVLKDMYSFEGTLELEHCINYINNTDLVIDYLFNIGTTLLNFCLIYNTDNRTWRTHIFESQGLLKMYKSDATKDGTLATFSTGFVKVQNSYTFDLISVLTPVIQFFKRTPNEPDDYYLLNDYNTELPEQMKELYYSTHKYKNYQLLDTGYRALDEVNMKKRHREFQLRFNNKSEKPLHFGTTFYIDGEDRKNMYKYEIEHNTDITSENYGVINVVPKLDTNVEIPGTTLLYALENDINSWTLDVSQFPQVPLIKARVSVSGKGYHSRLKLLSVNELNYELLGLCWVFKYKNLR